MGWEEGQLWNSSLHSCCPPAFRSVKICLLSTFHHCVRMREAFPGQRGGRSNQLGRGSAGVCLSQQQCHGLHPPTHPLPRAGAAFFPPACFSLDRGHCIGCHCPRHVPC